ncbi:MAG: cytochrome c oxidase subunit 3 family protein [Planctomycetes bacterium]|nr:cytochrome c oxidase subunit 3 family protein [Planctomycetota bacterium]
MSTSVAEQETSQAALPERPKQLAMHFDTLHQQFTTGKLAMWLFLGQELLFFTGLFTAYAVYRGNHQEMFHYAHYFLDWRLGGANTIVLLTSSLTAAWSVRCAQLEQRKGLLITLALTFLCAAAFMCIKYVEYSHKIHIGAVWGSNFGVPLNEFPEHLREKYPDLTPEQLQQMGTGSFFAIYFCMTGLHGIHVLVGMALYAWLFIRALRGSFNRKYYGAVDNIALYWHIVDIIWIFLFPLLYLIG